GGPSGLQEILMDGVAEEEIRRAGRVRRLAGLVTAAIAGAERVAPRRKTRLPSEGARAVERVDRDEALRVLHELTVGQQQERCERGYRGDGGGARARVETDGAPAVGEIEGDERGRVVAPEEQRGVLDGEHARGSHLALGHPLHDGPEGLLPLQKMGLSLSDEHIGSVEQLLTTLDQDLCRVPYLLRPVSHLGWQHDAAEQMRANTLGEIATAPGTHVRATPQKIRSELRHTKMTIAGHTARDVVIRAVDEEHGALFGAQASSPGAVQVGQAACGQLDHIGERDWTSALRPLHLHGQPRARDNTAISSSCR